jgi:predicted nucleic acid-binding protein
VRFWDSSAIVPLLLEETARERMLAALDSDPVMLVWWATPVELVSALSRRERDTGLSLIDATAVIDRIRALERAWQTVLPTDAIRTRAQRLLRVHALRAADSLQLAAALSIAGDVPGSLAFMCLDRRLADAARREGLSVAPECAQ